MTCVQHAVQPPARAPTATVDSRIRNASMISGDFLSMVPVSKGRAGWAHSAEQRSRSIVSAGRAGSARLGRYWASVIADRGDSCLRQPTVVPNSFPTAALIAIARTPQNATRAAPTIADAPPAAAAIAPSAIRQTVETTDTVIARLLNGATRIVKTGTAAPAANEAADATAAWIGRAASSVVRPSSSRACAAS